MIMPALPKRFHYSTSFGQEWKPFWDRLWKRAKRAIDHAEELVLIGYSMPNIDKRACAMLLRTKNKKVRLSICCGNSTEALQLRFRRAGFSNVQPAPPTFDALMESESFAVSSPPIKRTPSIAAEEQPSARPESAICPLRSMLVATAQRRPDGKAIYSEEGTPLQNRVLTVAQLRTQLSRNGAFSDNIEKFVRTLLADGFAEIRQPLPKTHVSHVG
jgi:hypothetical protein